ncbi:carboxypeptidase-like regulatory domain-containing protein [Engelhardtia mirabilis]|uniref:Uncharacterized protein n=1 Tax=Engelhardtia mirabilis TaxID=2528011 RepID=A0A518BG38_9BACT|nr:hypothetical protein Pla133_10180 [Planctomycetes bacterium Pla133]QDV00278.1 hypothetical protein Pla86_10170 [Planctomycetes bacterium Pla86]
MRSLVILGALLLGAGLLFWALVGVNGPTDRSGASAAARPDGRTTAGGPLVPVAELEPSGDGERAAAVDDVATDAVAAAQIPSRLGLRFVDPRDGSAVADLPYVVFSERRPGFLADSGRSGAGGRAEVDRLPGDAWLVLTERRPPFAATLRAFWLEPGDEREVDVELDLGGSVVGRAVDDLGRPVQGAVVRLTSLPTRAYRLAREPRGLGELDDSPAATTDADGRFRVDALLSQPLSVWIDDQGRERPERLEPIALRLFDPSALDGPPLHFSAHAASGEVTDVGPLVLPRASRVSGVVVDSFGVPIDGALVIGGEENRWDERWSELPLEAEAASWYAPLADRPGASLTDAAGRFACDLPGTLADGASTIRLVVLTDVGYAIGPVLILEPGEVVNDLRIEVPLRPLVSLEVVGPDGRHVSSLGAVRVGADRSVAIVQPKAGFIYRVDLALHDRTVYLEARAEQDIGAWGAQLQQLPGGFARGVADRWIDRPFEVVVCLPGFAPTRTTLTPAVGHVMGGRATLEPAPRRTLRFVAASEPAVRSRTEVRLDGVVELDGEIRQWSDATSLWSDDLPFDLDLVGSTEEVGSVEIHLGAGVTRTLDSLEPRAEPYVVEVPFGVDAPQLGDASMPDEPRSSGRSVEPAVLRIEVVDGVTGQPVRGARVQPSAREVYEGGLVPHTGFPSETDDRGRTYVRVSNFGPLDVILRSPDHKTKLLDVRALVPGEDRDLGIVSLEPRPRFEVQVVGEGHAPLAGAVVHFDFLDGTTDEEGRCSFPIREGDDDPRLLGVALPFVGDEFLERIHFQTWMAPPEAGSVTPVVATDWRLVEVHVATADPPRWLEASTPSPSGEVIRWGRGAVAGLPLAKDGRFLFALGLGTWATPIAWGDDSPSTFVVEAGSGRQVVTVGD